LTFDLMLDLVFSTPTRFRV